MKTSEENKKITSGVIVTPEVKEIRPKVLFSEGVPTPKESNAPSTLSEKSGKVGDIKPKVLFGSATPLPKPMMNREDKKPVKPTIILSNSTLRQRISVSSYELRTTIGALCAENIITRAIEHIRVTNLDDGRDDKVLHWGSELQQRLSRLLDEEMRIVKAGTIDGSKKEMGEIFTTLQRLDLEESLPRIARDGIVKSLVKRIRRKDPKTQFDSVYADLQAIIKKLEVRMPELRMLMESAQKLVSETEVLTGEVEAMIIAGKYLTYYIRSGKYTGEGQSIRLEEQMQILDQRIESLSSTQSTLKMSIAQREFQVRSLAHIIDCVQNTLLVDIPAWRTNYLCVLSAIMSGNQPDSSVFGDLIKKQQKIMERTVQNEI